jgi:hypothetical protein
MKVQGFNYNLASNKKPKSKIDILTISGPMSLKPPIVAWPCSSWLGHFAAAVAWEEGLTDLEAGFPLASKVI